MTNDEVSCLKTDIFTVFTPHLTEHSLLWHTTAFKDQLTGGGRTDAQLVFLNRERIKRDKKGAGKEWSKNSHKKKSEKHWRVESSASDSKRERVTIKFFR